MTKKKAGAAASVAAGAAAAKGSNNADIRSFLQKAAGGQVAGGQASGGGQGGGGLDQAATVGKRKATSPKEQTAKRMEYQEEDDDVDVFEEAQEVSEVMGGMTKELIDAGLSPQQAAIAMNIFMKGFQALVKKAAKEAAAAVVREVDKANVDAPRGRSTGGWRRTGVGDPSSYTMLTSGWATSATNTVWLST